MCKGVLEEGWRVSALGCVYLMHLTPCTYLPTSVSAELESHVFLSLASS
jgi:hypothetical protein